MTCSISAGSAKTRAGPKASKLAETRMGNGRRFIFITVQQREPTMLGTKISARERHPRDCKILLVREIPPMSGWLLLHSPSLNKPTHCHETTSPHLALRFIRHAHPGHRRHSGPRESAKTKPNSSPLKCRKKETKKGISGTFRTL